QDHQRAVGAEAAIEQRLADRVGLAPHRGVVDGPPASFRPALGEKGAIRRFRRPAAQMRDDIGGIIGEGIRTAQDDGAVGAALDIDRGGQRLDGAERRRQRRRCVVHGASPSPCSRAAHSICPSMMCISCIRAVTEDGTTSATSHKGFAAPPSPPSSPIVMRPRSRATVSARSTFSLRPEVEIATATSPLRPSASICRENTWAKPRSLPAAVRAVPSAVSAMAAMAARSRAYRTVSSVARCWASDALPPLPKNSSLPPPATLSTHTFAAAANGSRKDVICAASARCSANSASKNLAESMLFADARVKPGHDDRYDTHRSSFLGQIPRDHGFLGGDELEQDRHALLGLLDAALDRRHD